MTQSMFLYTWNIDETETEITAIQIFGITESRQTICVRVHDFTPFVYVELPLINNNEHFWTNVTSQQIATKIDQLMGNKKPLKKTFVKKEKLYYASFNADGKRKRYPFLFLTFSNRSDIKTLIYALKHPIYVCNRLIQFNIHEQDADPILQFTSSRNINNAGWITFNGQEIEEDNKISHCYREYLVKSRDIIGDPTNNTVVQPTLLSYDIEVNSTVPTSMPRSDRPGDKIFQISCILSISGDNVDNARKFLLSLGTPTQEKVGNDVTIITCLTEALLICEFSKFIIQHNPHIIIGYNIFKFDIQYMIDRSRHTHTSHDFLKQGMLKDINSKTKKMAWSSAAHKNQEFHYVDAEGRIFIDLLPIIQTDHRLSDYKLKTVSAKFIGDTKDDLSVQGIFKCYKLGMKGGINGNNALGIVGKYCIQDSLLVTKLFEKLQLWIGQTEMSRTFNVPIVYLFLRGQQIKVYSQIYKKCMTDNIVVQKNAYITSENEHYQGATVFSPVPGLYDKVIPFDFASLYPSTIIAYNIDYSTLVKDDTIPDERCHVIEFEDHIGCEHDITKHKTKPKHILCAPHRYRFIKEPLGVLPTILRNLLDARSRTKTELKIVKNSIKNETDPLEISKKEIFCNVLDKRQLAYKVSANSMYGAMGVTKGLLPFTIGAMCTTAMGRKSIDIVAKVIPEKYGGVLIYGDTDSNYVTFPHLHTAEECWTHAEHVATEVSKLFPSPMNLAFEEVIYWRFFVLTKKRYMSIACGRDGILRPAIEKKGVLLARRDNSLISRDIYGTIVKNIFDRVNTTDILKYLICQLQLLFSNSLPTQLFIITKSIGDHGNFVPIPIINEKKVHKLQIGDYVINRITDQTHQFKLKNCSTEQEYYLHSLPAQVQLAEKMRNRGQRVEIGSRPEFVVTVGDGHKAKQYTKLESYDYFITHKSVLHIDFLYYLKSIINPLDEVFNIVMTEQNIVLKLYKSRIQFSKVIGELKKLFSPIIVFTEKK